MTIGDPPPFMPWNDVTGYLPLNRFDDFSCGKRDDGSPARVGDSIRIERGFIHFDPPAATDDVPNRLYGATINEQGDAI